jgi:hypothetical protein
MLRFINVLNVNSLNATNLIQVIIKITLLVEMRTVDKGWNLYAMSHFVTVLDMMHLCLQC